jgi:hypothetical protein
MPAAILASPDPTRSDALALRREDDCLFRTRGKASERRATGLGNAAPTNSE